MSPQMTAGGQDEPVSSSRSSSREAFRQANGQWRFVLPGEVWKSGNEWHRVAVEVSYGRFVPLRAKALWVNDTDNGGRAINRCSGGGGC